VLHAKESQQGNGASRVFPAEPLSPARRGVSRVEQAQSGCKHKEKAAEKHEQRVAAAVSATTAALKPLSTKEEKKEKIKKKVVKDANGNELKRPLSAYMLYNNHRRPTLRSEHPGKCVRARRRS